jgi:hypothetical protein
VVDIARAIEETVGPAAVAGRATLTLEMLPTHVSARVTPVNRDACPVLLAAPAFGDVHLRIGDPTLEVDLYAGDEREGEELLVAGLRAILDGRVETVAWTRGGDVVSGRVRFDLDSRPLTLRCFHRLAVPSKRVRRRYAAYGEVEKS